MYCKNCGAELDSPNAVCQNCGVGGEMNGGWEVYQKRVTRINYFKLTAQILSILLIGCLLFLPIYRGEYSIDVLESTGTRDAFSKKEWVVHSNDRIECSFSAFEDVMVMGDYLLDDNAVNGKWLYFSLNGLFLFFEIFFSVIILGSIISQALKTARDILNPQDATILLYRQISKTGTQVKKEKVVRKNAVLSIVLYAIFDIVETRWVGALFGSELFRSEYWRFMMGYVGFSKAAVVAVICLVGLVVVKFLEKREEENLTLEIAKSEINV